ncbi:MAG: Uma2 family endonuclease [Pyrinomonadaceae bacterium]|nr:Uma2 family endonuclease [Pyrinomonadaceae bacterium]
MATYNHSYLCFEISTQIIKTTEFKPLPELSLAIGNGIKPDISVYAKNDVPPPNFLQDITRYEKMPILAIEIISPSQNIQDLLEKADLLIENGVKNVWTVEPFTNTVFVTNESGVKRFHKSVVENDGIKVDFAAIFNS